MQHDLGFDPMPNDDSTWEQYYETAKWLTKNKQDGIPYGSGHQAKQHDSLMNDFSNVLWAYGGDYFDKGADVGRLGSDDPGEPRWTPTRRSQAADMYRKLLSVAHPVIAGLGLDGLGEAFPAGQCAMAVEWHEFAAGFETGKLTGKVGYAPLPKGPKRRASMYGGTGIGINGTASQREQKAAWLFVNWATSPKTQLANLKSKVGGGTPTRESIYELPEVEKATNPPSKMPNILTDGRRVRGVEAGEHRPAAEDRGLERVRHGDLHPALEDARRPAGAGPVHAQGQGRLRRRIDRAAALRKHDGRTRAVGGRPRASPAAREPERRSASRRRCSRRRWSLLAPLSIFPFIYIIADEPLAGGADRRDPARLGRPRQLDAAVQRRAVGASWLRSIVYFVLTVGLEMPLGIVTSRCAITEPVRGRNTHDLAAADADVHGAGDRRPARPLPDRLDLRPLRLVPERDRPLHRRHPGLARRRRSSP